MQDVLIFYSCSLPIKMPGSVPQIMQNSPQRSLAGNNSPKLYGRQIFSPEVRFHNKAKIVISDRKIDRKNEFNLIEGRREYLQFAGIHP